MNLKISHLRTILREAARGPEISSGSWVRISLDRLEDEGLLRYWSPLNPHLLTLRLIEEVALFRFRVILHNNVNPFIVPRLIREWGGVYLGKSLLTQMECE